MDSVSSKGNTLSGLSAGVPQAVEDETDSATLEGSTSCEKDLGAAFHGGGELTPGWS